MHISQICNRYIRHPSEVLKVGDIVRVKVLDVDLKRKRISLTMKDLEGGEKTMMQGKGESVCPGNGFQSGR